MKKIALVIVVLIIAVAAAYLWQSKEASAPSVPVETSDGIPVPHIDSVTPNKARVGDKIEIRGTHFSGFEGDKYAWIENAQGVKGVIYSDYRVATDSFIPFTLEAKYCTRDMSYIGGACPSYMDIVPGAYKIYVYPWGKESNKVEFTVVK